MGTPLRGELLHRAIQERIKRLISERRLGPGDPLPSEGQLALDFGVGRNSVREAVKALQTLGVVVTRHGRGLFVGDLSLEPLLGNLVLRVRAEAGQATETIAEMVEARQVLESYYVRRAALALRPEDLAELRRLAIRMEERAAADEPFDHEDRSFHETLYRCLGNKLIVELIGAFWSVLFRARSELAIVPSPGVAAARSHRRIFEALEARDPAAAAAAMALHFSQYSSGLETPARGSVVGR